MRRSAVTATSAVRFCRHERPLVEVNVLGSSARVISPYLKLVGEYKKSLENYLNPKAVNMTEFRRVTTASRRQRQRNQ